MTQQIQIQNASLKFRIYRNRAPALKEAVIGLLTGKRDKDAVTEFDALKKINLTIRAGDRLGVIGNALHLILKRRSHSLLLPTKTSR